MTSGFCLPSENVQTLTWLLDPADCGTEASKDTRGGHMLLHLLKSRVSGRFSPPFSPGCIGERKEVVGPVIEWAPVLCGSAVCRCVVTFNGFYQKATFPPLNADIYVNRWSGDIFLRQNNDHRLKKHPRSSVTHNLTWTQIQSKYRLWPSVTRATPSQSVWRTWLLSGRLLRNVWQTVKTLGNLEFQFFFSLIVWDEKMARKWSLTNRSTASISTHRTNSVLTSHSLEPLAEQSISKLCAFLAVSMKCAQSIWGRVEVRWAEPHLLLFSVYSYIQADYASGAMLTCALFKELHSEVRRGQISISPP